MLARLRSTPTPPTPRPAEGQGPWYSETQDRWWVVAPRPQDALAAVDGADPDAMPIYFGWKVIVEPVLIAWSEEEPDEFGGFAVEEQPYETEATVEAWRITVEGA